jgi:uncharacterized damage-inducible protein DinB
MDSTWKSIVWQQFGAAIDTLDNAIVACPDELWDDRSKRHEFWYVVFHTLFWLDLYLSESPEGFAPPTPFGLEELDPAGVIPERPYSKDELRTYLMHCRNKCRTTIEAMTDETARQRIRFGRVDLSRAELFLYSMRHVQHHAAQLNLILRQTIDSAPGWVFQAKVNHDS